MLATVADCPHNADVELPTELKDENRHLQTALPAVSREFDFPGILSSVPASRDQIMEFIESHCVDQGDRIDMLVAVQEALANAALHGCKDDPSKLIHCVVTADDSDITVVVRDPGPGFNLELADPDKFQASTLTHGRGICLIRSLVSEVDFTHRGAEIRMRKHLTRGT